MTDKERRAEERSDCAIAAKIELSDRLAVPVTLKDLSITGVRLKVAEATDLPEEFDLLVPVIDTVEMRHRVKVVWRRGDELGGEFITPGGISDVALPSSRSARC